MKQIGLFEAQTYAAMTGPLRKMGRPPPAFDTMIAATARHHGLVVATLNVKDFQDIPGVTIEDWAHHRIG